MKPKPPPTSTAVAMRWPADLHAEITRAAKAQGRSFSEFVRSAALREARQKQ